MKINIALTLNVETNNCELLHEHLDKSDELSNMDDLKHTVHSRVRPSRNAEFWSKLSRLSAIVSILSFLKDLFLITMLL